MCIQVKLTHMSLHILQTDVDALDHHQEVGLKHERFARMVQHAHRLLQLGEVLQSRGYSIRSLQEPVLGSFSTHAVSGGRNVAHALLEQALTGVLQTAAALFDAPPLLDHAGDVRLDIANRREQSVACFAVSGDGRKVYTEMRLLTVRDGAVNSGKPVVELLWCRYGELWVQRVGGLRDWSGRPRGWRAGKNPALANFAQRRGRSRWALFRRELQRRLMLKRMRRTFVRTLSGRGRSSHSGFS